MSLNNTDLLNQFLTYLRDYRKTSANTLSAYLRDLNSFITFLDTNGVELNDVTDVHVSSYKDILIANGKSVATVSRSMSTLRTFYKFLTVKGIIVVNPTSNVKNDKTEKKFFQVLSEDEIDKLLATPDSTSFKGRRDQAMLEVLYATGMKVSELISLDVSDINLKMSFIHCRGGKDRIIMLYPNAVKIISDYLTKSRAYFVTDPTENALFVNTNGERMTRQGFWKLLKHYADTAGISTTITPHTLRHSFATHLLENGADINDIKNILGHSDISSTNVYSDFIKAKHNDSYLRFNHRFK